jgi:hypothetical protein
MEVLVIGTGFFVLLQLLITQRTEVVVSHINLPSVCLLHPLNKLVDLLQRSLEIQLLDENQGQSEANLFNLSLFFLGQREPFLGIGEHFFSLKENGNVEDRNEGIRLENEGLLVAVDCQEVLFLFYFFLGFTDPLVLDGIRIVL